MMGNPLRDPVGPEEPLAMTYQPLSVGCGGLQMANYSLGMDGVVEMLLGSLL